jgi:hypothetical protein
MSQEITFTGSLSGFQASTMTQSQGLSVIDLKVNMTGSGYSRGSILVGTSPTVIPLNGMTQPHWAWFNNLDSVNYITIRNGSGGIDLCQYLPGEQCPIPLINNCVPYAVANNAPCRLEYLIFSF